MPVRMITDRIIEIGTSLFLIVGSGHFDLPKPIAKETAAAVQKIPRFRKRREVHH